MKLALDIDNVLLDWDGFIDARMAGWCKRHCIPCAAKPNYKEYDMDAKYGISSGIWCQVWPSFGYELEEEYRQLRVEPETVEFVTELWEIGWELCVLTHREGVLREATEYQLQPVFERVGKIPVYFTDGDKSAVMRKEGIRCLVDDSPSVIRDVIRFQKLDILSPLKDYNAGYPTLYYSSHAQAVKILRSLYNIRGGR